MQTLTPFLTIFHRKTLILVKNKNLSVIKRSVGGALTKTLYKGVSGGFTLSDNLFNVLNSNRGIVPFYLVNLIKSVPTKAIQSTQDIYETSKDLVFSFDKMCHNPIFTQYTNIVVETTKKGFTLQKPTGFLAYNYPWKQHFISHLTYKKVYDPTEVVFYKKYPDLIDSSSYNNTGMTLQNFIEFQALMPLFDSIHAKFFSDNNLPNVKISLQNYEKPTDHKFKSYSSIQANPDALIKIYRVQNGRECEPIVLKKAPVDAKIIENPIMYGPPIGGNIFAAMPFEKANFYAFLTRITAKITNNMEKLPDLEKNKLKDYIKALFALQNKLKMIKISLDDKTIFKCYDDFYKIILNMLYDPDIKETLPSILVFIGTETDVMHTFNNEEYAHFLKNGTGEMYPQALFPPMGTEDTVSYKETVYAYIQKFPEPFRSELHAQLDTYISILDQFAVKHITWK